MLALLYDKDVEILERSWPRGLEIGVSSAIGLDCWLMSEINLDFNSLASSARLNVTVTSGSMSVPG